MNLKISTLCSIFVFSLFGTCGTATSASWLKTSGQASRPFGHVEYCASRKADCKANKRVADLRAVSLAKLKSVNVAVNRAIKPVSDQDLYGTREKWVTSAKAGDCEDYALAKRAKLSRLGIPKSSLLLAVGRTKGQAHTVLVVRTRDGDFVMNNLTDEVLPVSRARLGITKIQSPENSAEWLRVSGITGKAS